MPIAKVELLFKAPGPQVNGLQATPDGLWLGDQVNNRIYKVSYAGEVLALFDTPARNLSGITFGGGAVWGAHNARPSGAFKLNPGNGQCLAWLPFPDGQEGGVHGIEFVDGALWVTRPGLLNVMKLNPNTGELLHVFPFPTRRSHGIYWDNGTFVIAATDENAIYRLDPSDGTILGRWKVEGCEAHGLAKGPDGQIWVCDIHGGMIGTMTLG
jgi:streptogramin lyase